MNTFSPFLPQDNDETPEGEIVVSAIADGLYVLLRQRASEFWEEVKNNKSLLVCLGTYLQFSRWDAFPQSETSVLLNLMRSLTVHENA